MKKKICILSCFIMMLLFTACGKTNLRAKEGEAAKGFLWKNNYSEITITGYEGKLNDIVIPKKINGKVVTKISAGAFEGFSQMKSVKIPGSVKDISGAFRGCTGLKKVELEEGIENMDSAFYGCKSIEKIKLPKTIKSMHSAFYNCKKLKEVNVPTKVKSLSGTFGNCSALVSIKLPNSIISLRDTFAGCSSLTDVILPEKVTDIGGAFYKCTSLKKMEVPEGVTYIGDAFDGCKSLEILVLPNTLEEGFSIQGLKSIKKITMSQELLLDILDETEENEVCSICDDANNEGFKELNAKVNDFVSYTYGTSFLNKEIKNIGNIRYEVLPYDEEYAYSEEIEIQSGKKTQKTYYLARPAGNYWANATDIKIICCEDSCNLELRCDGKSSQYPKEVEINGLKFPIICD